jgi:hypothetical protein
MTPQQKDLILNALRIGYSFGLTEYASFSGTKSAEGFLIARVKAIELAIKELEAMPTEVQPNGEIK